MLLRRPAASFASLALAAVLASTPSSYAAVPAAAPTPTDPVVTGFALDSLSSGQLAASADALDAVTVAGIGLKRTGAAVSKPTAQMGQVRSAIESRGLHSELLVSNYSDRLGEFDAQALHRLLGDPARTRKVARQVAALATAGGWDGVNVDLELVRAGDAGGLVSFVEQVRAGLPEASTVSVDVSAATSPAAYRRGGYRLAALGRAADVVVLMTYDQHGPTWSGPGPIGDLRWQRKAVRAAASVVPATQLDLGIAGYGYTWPRKGTGRTVTVAAARRLVKRDGARARWHAASGEWSARLDNGTVMWWSDARSYDGRVQLARDLGVHGVAVWRLGSADPLR